MDKNKKIRTFDEINFNFIDNLKKQNDITIKINKKEVFIVGNSFDGAKIIDNILDGSDDNKFFTKDFNKSINININNFFINKDDYVKNLKGKAELKNNKIESAVFTSFFPNNKNIGLRIMTNIEQEKITNLYTRYPQPLIKRYNFIKGFEEGVLDFQSIEKNDISSSVLIIDNFKVKEVPVLAKLLTLASLQGIADLLTGEGIRFTDFEMKYSKNKNLIKIEEVYAIGPAISLMMSGYIEKNNLISLRGTLVPATTINRTISSIPLLGDILVGKKVGEGVFGVSFKIKGPPDDLKTTVNPIKSLTPRFITRTLEKIKN